MRRRLSLFVSVQTVVRFLRINESWHGSSIDPLTEASIMGKYLLGWLLGVPVIVLVIIYLIFN